MMKINFIVFFVLFAIFTSYGQVLNRRHKIVFSGVVINAQDSEEMPNVACRYGQNRGVYSDSTGCFRIETQRGDTVLFTSIGFKSCQVIIPDSLFESEYMMGIFMSPDTVMLSEVLIFRRWKKPNRQNMLNAQNNMRSMLNQAYAPVKSMDASMNQEMLINEFARSIEMKGHIDVQFGVGTHSMEAYNLLRMQNRLTEKKEWLHWEEIDMLKKIHYLEKKEKQNN